VNNVYRVVGTVPIALESSDINTLPLTSKRRRRNFHKKMSIYRKDLQIRSSDMIVHMIIRPALEASISKVIFALL
jgi:hypothetical protein